MSIDIIKLIKRKDENEFLYAKILELQKETKELKLENKKLEKILKDFLSICKLWGIT